jgi:LacI family repressor for deo operon, udp, cdd, tsx, nupC, and nupG
LRDGRTERRAVTIADVAAMAGVSTATVSRALSEPAQLRTGTLARVTAAVQQSGYRPNIAARTLRAGRAMLALVVVPDIANPFFSDVLRGIEDELSRHHYGLLIGNLNNGRAREAQIVDMVRAGQVDGVLLLNGRVPHGGGQSLTQTGVPAVAVCETVEGALFPQVEVCNREAAREAVAHLAALGHRRLAYVTGPAHNVLEQERQAGFHEGLAAAGLDGACVLPGDFTFAAGAAAATVLLAQEPRPTAVFAANDEMAIGLMKTAWRAGLEVPRDLSVIGFDGIEFADYVQPTLTTFRQPRRELGQRGAALLVRAMLGEVIPACEARLRLPATLLVRDSTGPAPKENTA